MYSIYSVYNLIYSIKLQFFVIKSDIDYLLNKIMLIHVHVLYRLSLLMTFLQSCWKKIKLKDKKIVYAIFIV